MIRSFLLPLIFSLLNVCYAGEIDSLITSLKLADNDSLRTRICHSIADKYEGINPSKSIEWVDKGVVFAKRSKDNELICSAISYSNYYYHNTGDYEKALELCLQGMKIAEKHKLFERQASFAGKIGANYLSIEDQEQTIMWLTKAVDLYALYDAENIASALDNLGGYYANVEEYDSAFVYMNRAVKIYRQQGDIKSLARTLGNIATCYIGLERYTDAEKILNESYTVRSEIGDQYGIAKMYMDFSWLYGNQKMYSLAIKYADSSRLLAIELNNKEFQHLAAAQMAKLYSEAGDYKMAYKFYQETHNTWKELHEQESTENLNELRTLYETEKIEGENLILKKDDEIQKAAISNQRIVIFSAGAGLLILIGFVYYLNKWNKQKRKTNIELRVQKGLVEQKNEEILDSINYAKRIQTAILPQDSLISEYLPNSFVLYKPKDVVAGDFYWIEKKDGKVLFAAADCTGHGVPGAMVSVVCNNGLNRAVREHGLSTPGEILDQTRAIITSEFEKSKDDVKDGMDIALCSLKDNILEYAGANNPLWIIRAGELIEIKADKQPVGKFENNSPYKTHRLELNPGDQMVIFSDGYADQFGGERGKKFKSTNFKKLLLSIADMKMNEQSFLLDEAFEKWKGQLEQLDDVCIFSVKI